MNPLNLDQNTSLQVRRLFTAPRERVFHAWIERDALQRWLKSARFASMSQYIGLR